MSKTLPITEPATDRKCGECQVCCLVMDVRPTNEEVTLSHAFERCQFLCDVGCSIYEHRPSPCEAYHCMWRLGWGGPEDRPDRLGVLMEASPNGWLFAIEARPEAYKSPAVQETMQALRYSNPPTTAVHVTPWGAIDPCREGYWDGEKPEGLQDATIISELLKALKEES